MRLIDADKLPFRDLSDGKSACLVVFANDVNDAPTVEIVSCRDCKHWYEWENGAGSCGRANNGYWVGTDASDYCSFGERKNT